MKKEVSYKTFDWAQLDKYLQFKITLKMASELMECSQTTIKDYIKKKFDMTFTEYADLKMTNVKLRLIQKALDMAFKGDRTMLIFCLKNICNWADKAELEQVTIEKFEFVGDDE